MYICQKDVPDAERRSSVARLATPTTLPSFHSSGMVTSEQFARTDVRHVDPESLIDAGPDVGQGFGSRDARVLDKAGRWHRSDCTIGYLGRDDIDRDHEQRTGQSHFRGVTVVRLRKYTGH